ncbi:MAG TPA: YiiD C-terminal domain-containing protein [Ktedonobacteraceae bacterium]|jgi:thioesterase domain-containing protein
MQNLQHELQDVLLTDIPITKYLGISVESYDTTCLVLKAPLANNMNHKGTAFAGSLNSLITLSGWGLLWLILREYRLTARIVIQDSECNYLLPVTSDFSACCRKPEAYQLEKLVQTLQKKGKARLELNASILQNQQLAVSFKGRYVAQCYDCEQALHPYDVEEREHV